MIRFITYLFLVVSFLGGTECYAQNKSKKTKKYLGVIFQPNQNQELVGYAILTFKKKKLIDTHTISEDRFLRISAGTMDKDVNVDGADLCIKKLLDNEPGFKNSLDLGITENFKPTRNLWKIRYTVDPFSEIKAMLIGDESGIDVDKGWASNDDTPSKVQMTILKSFGVKSFGEYIYGLHLYELILATTDPMWIAAYKAN